MSLIKDLVSIVGEKHVIKGKGKDKDEEALAPYLTDWRGRFTGRAHAVVRPGNTQEVADVVKLCARYEVPIVTQGGNTGLCGGATPSNKGDAVLLVMTRLNHILNVDTVNDTITVQAGCILQQVQEAAAKQDRLFPLSLGAEGSCTIGGNLATNAGGTQVLRYGNARDLALGLEVVTPEGEILNGLRSLRKDNTGYDLRNLYIGSEGTLGIITAATLKLYPQPVAQCTALVAFESLEDALYMLNYARKGFASKLEGFELMSDYCLKIVNECFPEQSLPLSLDHPWYALIHMADSDSEEKARETFQAVLEEAFENDIIQDAVLAESIQQSQDLWHMRESIPLAEAIVGKGIKNDISVPISRIAPFVDDTNTALQSWYPGVRHIIFGHLGDGNLHYNIGAPIGEEDGFLAKQDEAFKIVFDSVVDYDGSISAEHGIGQLKKDMLPDYKDEVEISVMRKIKRALDPQGLMNPGKVVDSVDFDY
ncbi:MAG: FAD-binding oxidoreductase [Alcaligenaceae bacterium]|jgi:glycolate oxidase subunit GlcD|nr:FAD-binding oxidoreductase [Alcaligenaceae bacterium]